MLDQVPRQIIRRQVTELPEIQPVIDQIQRGEMVGDKIQGTGYMIFKVRIRSSDVSRGKSGGHRAIYYLKTPTAVVFVIILFEDRTIGHFA